MKIVHLANWNSTNIGNGALIYGTERVISEDFSEQVEFLPEAWDDYTFKKKFFDEDFVDLVNSNADALLINGAVTFNAYRRSYTATGMRFNLPLELWDKINKPIIFYGVSYRCWPFQKYPNREAFKAMLVKATTDKKVFFCVRNDGTKEWIAKNFGIDSEHVHEVPDPGLFVPASNLEYPELHETKKNVIISFNGEDPMHRFATVFEKTVIRVLQNVVDPARLDRFLNRFGLYRLERDRIIKEIVRAVEGISKEIDTQFILVPHYLDDYGMIQRFIELVREHIAHQCIVSTGLVGVPHTAYFYGRYAKADLAISMRVHSMSPSIGLGIPVVPITSQGRMRNFLKKAGLSDIAVDVSEKGFGDTLQSMSISLLKDPSSFKNNVAPKVEIMRERYKVMNAQIEAFIGKNS
ncbi:polysaccharide pyruvyl transferase family protein [Patescibacteria group bacterium]|nr:polysaccharide pyruvyl transferase family protein [Patescibacteria group bacterium]MBU1755028.1 polysaccharide pyruvyl transferase family protein [Patescibacteria group bacterium]